VGDVREADAEPAERALERMLVVLDPIDVRELGAHLVAGSVVHQDAAALTLEEQAAHGETDAIALVGRLELGPERLGHRAEHRSAVEPHETGLDGVDAPGTELQRGHARRMGESRRGVKGRGGFPTSRSELELLRLATRDRVAHQISQLTPHVLRDARLLATELSLLRTQHALLRAELAL